jgi:hypothetical protein
MLRGPTPEGTHACTYIIAHRCDTCYIQIIYYALVLDDERGSGHLLSVEGFVVSLGPLPQPVVGFQQNHGFQSSGRYTRL